MDQAIDASCPAAAIMQRYHLHDLLHDLVDVGIELDGEEFAAVRA